MYRVVLEGKIKTPIVTKHTKFNVLGCQAEIIKPKRRHFTKINSHQPMIPYSFYSYLGNIELRYTCKTMTKAKDKINNLLGITHLKRFYSEGMGKIEWVKGVILEGKKAIDLDDKRETKKKIIYPRFRKALPPKLPRKIQHLLMYALCHDFVHTSIHPSKIYVELSLKDIEFLELLKKSHDKVPNNTIKLSNYYDKLSSSYTRKFKSYRINRYNWDSAFTFWENRINFSRLGNDLTKIVDRKDVRAVYEYVYNSRELDMLNESLEYGHTSLKVHLLIMANLIVRDYLRGKLQPYLDD